ncbi:MAG: ISL3 family transposase, partial [Lachnospiraceae bacterium]|nr:ISL3 family transposase [Lachnospiraceae bacterium]
RMVLDILPKRKMYYLTEYFREYSVEERSAVNIFISDMWKSYADISSIFFKSTTYVVDKYHWIRQVIWAFENVRKAEQKKFSSSYRRYFKRSKTLLNKKFESLDDQQKTQVNVMLYASPTLSSAYFLKEQFLDILSCKSREQAQKKLIQWINSASICGIDSFHKCAKTMLTWITGILNSFTTKFTNGFTEGCNNKIKVLKRNAYGYRNFKRFRNRIIQIFSNQRQARA